ncbi:RluA family pseudouridine synthase [Candidatus Nitronereus thalassa]|uniref:Pseudouridine synthase n=1 Tax=Candidatus Nitronereus thalassa TaxID=3020898 RepID=A0ABU3K4M5_9BACT|nr:RluA family pseudouridine synthase [Candidatus Nitronereus thalassa]MDT7041319.1 RluA family pseudouridine synthase [Candidatus Nitronereus thalassa]
MITQFVITPGEKPKRLDVFLRHREPDISRTCIQRLIELGRIRLNTAVVKPSHTVKPGDRITIDTPQPETLSLAGKTVPLDVLYEDECHLVLNKPAGIVVHPTSGHWSGTLLNAILSHFQLQPTPHHDSIDTPKPRFVHRLDKNTSGVMVVAKTREAHRALAWQFEQHTITRVYEALIWDIPADSQGVINLPIGRDRKNRKLVSAQTNEPKPATTEYRMVQRFGKKASHVQLVPKTGRTHQIRAHMGSIGCPILGDTTYGGQKVNSIEKRMIPRVMLHARTLGFRHPKTGKFQEYSTTLPSDMQSTVQALKN